MDSKMNSENTIISWVVACIAAAAVASLLMATFGRIGTTQHPITRAITHCRQIILANKLYAADHGGAYPDAAVPTALSSNEVFRQLFVAGATQDEKFFGSPVSPFLPDGDIGHAPEFLKAVEPGENHWACMTGLKELSPGSIPLIFENPSVAEWPPCWNADVARTAVKGRTWSGGKIIIGTNDGSVELQKLESATGAAVTFRPGFNPFEDAKRAYPDIKLRILDAATK